jgi:hypothetical protein
MGLMDRVKPLATQAVQRTQEAAREGKARMDQAQANRQADMLLRNLGALVYAERTGRGTADSQAEINRQVADLQAHEAANGISLAPQSSPSAGWMPTGRGGSAAGPGPTAPGPTAPGPDVPPQSAPPPDPF